MPGGISAIGQPETGLFGPSRSRFRVRGEQRLHLAPQYPGIVFAALDYPDNFPATGVPGCCREENLLQAFFGAQQLRETAFPPSIQRHSGQWYHQPPTFAPASSQLEFLAACVPKILEYAVQSSEAEQRRSTAATTAATVQNGASQVVGRSVFLEEVAIRATLPRVVELVLVVGRFQKSGQLRDEIDYAQIGGEHRFLGGRIRRRGRRGRQSELLVESEPRLLLDNSVEFIHGIYPREWGEDIAEQTEPTPQESAGIKKIAGIVGIRQVVVQLAILLLLVVEQHGQTGQITDTEPFQT